MPDTNAQQEPFRVAVFADFVCPYSFLAVEQLDRLAQEYDVKPLWRPHLLHPETPVEGCPRTNTEEGKAKRERLDKWAREMAPEIHPRIKFPEKRHYSLYAFEALEYAADHELDFAYKTKVYDMMWTEGADIGDPNTLLLAAERTGLDAEELAQALHDRTYAQRALDAIEQARRIGITNTPTIFLGRTRINGWHYYEVLQSVMEKQNAPKRAVVMQ